MSKKLAVALITLCPLVFLIFIAQLTFAQRRGVRSRTSYPVADRWYTFKGPDSDFTLDFPRAPQRDPDVQGPVTLIRGYSLTTKDGTRFSINFQDIGGDPRSRGGNEYALDYEEQATAAAREQGRRVVQVHRLAKNVVEFEYRITVEENNAEISYLERSIMRRGRVYSVSCGTVVDRGEIDRPACRRFFNSMRFLK